MKTMMWGKPVVKRCSWCAVKHRMDAQGNPISGYAGDDCKDVIFSDGICKIAEAVMDKDIVIKV